MKLVVICFHNSVRCAQVDETLAQLYMASDRYDLAERAINLSMDYFGDKTERMHFWRR